MCSSVASAHASERARLPCGPCTDARQALALYVNADPLDLVFVENTSAAVNAVLRSLPFAPDEAVVDFSNAYQMNREARSAPLRQRPQRLRPSSERCLERVQSFDPAELSHWQSSAATQLCSIFSELVLCAAAGACTAAPRARPAHRNGAVALSGRRAASRGRAGARRGGGTRSGARPEPPSWVALPRARLEGPGTTVRLQGTASCCCIPHEPCRECSSYGRCPDHICPPYPPVVGMHVPTACRKAAA